MKHTNPIMTLVKARKKEIFLILLLILLLLINITFASAQVSVSGKVTDYNDNTPLPGTTITVKGTSTGVIADIDGNYSIEAPSEESILVFSFVGYISEEIKIGAQRQIDVLLMPDLIMLNEFVAIGYGIQRKSDVTGAITSVDSEDINKTASANMVQALQGKAAGVHISSSSGAPGAPMNVRIRGVGSVNSTDPLYIIDGREGNFNNININDIESIEILKDASATAIYGSRGANGVIVVTTKRGQAGKPKLNLVTYSGVQNVTKTLDLLNADEYAQFMQQAYQNSNLSVPEAYSDSARLANGMINTNWQNELLSLAPVQSYYLSGSGGGENSNYSISTGYFNQDGILLNTNFERFTVRANSDFTINSWLRLGETFAASYTVRNAGYREAGTAFRNITLASPLMPVLDGNNLGGYAGPSIDLTGNNTTTNMVGLQEMIEDSQTSINPQLDLYAEIEPFSGLVFRTSGGIGANIDNNVRWVPKYDMGIISQGEAVLTDGRGITYNWVLENTLNYNTQIGKHNIGLLAGQTREYYTSSRIDATGRDYPYPELRLISGATSTNAVEYFQDWALSSYLGRIIYDYNSRYLFTSSIRRDGSSIFGPEKRYGIFPSFSAGWKFFDEPFLDAIIPDFISSGKLRAGWGQSGSQNFRPYLWQGLIQLHPNANYTFNGVDYIPGSYPENFGNRNLGWETVEQTNIGLDLAFWENRITFTLDYYDKITRDMLLILPQPSIIGNITDPPSNEGRVRNNGLEFDLTYRKMEGDFQYTAKANFTTINNEVLNLGAEGIRGRDLRNVNDLAPTMTMEGYPIGYFYGWKTDGIFQSQDEIDALSVIDEDGNFVRHYQSPETQPGDIKFVDMNGDGYIDDNDRTYLGKSIPDLVFGFIFNASYKRFDIAISMQGVYGADIYNRQRQLLGMPGNIASLGITDGNKLTDVLNAWTPENPSTTVPRAAINDGNLNSRDSDWWIEDGSYLRISNIQIGYDLGALIPAVGLDQARIYLSADNLLVLTRYSGYDPDLGQESINSYDYTPLLNNGVDYGIYPQSRIFTAGIQIGF
jgi:TonB-linked SusC/RagA family outer membrane protein